MQPELLFVLCSHCACGVCSVELAVKAGKSHTLFAETADEADSWVAGLTAAQSGDAGAKSKMSVADFDLLNVVGKGSFGKVMQVRLATMSLRRRGVIDLFVTKSPTM